VFNVNIRFFVKHFRPSRKIFKLVFSYSLRLCRKPLCYVSSIIYIYRYIFIGEVYWDTYKLGVRLLHGIARHPSIYCRYYYLNSHTTIYCVLPLYIIMYTRRALIYVNVRRHNPTRKRVVCDNSF